MKDKNYKSNQSPIIGRLVAIWRIFTCRNFILVDCTVNKDRGSRSVRVLGRTDYDSESDFLSLKVAALTINGNDHPNRTVSKKP